MKLNLKKITSLLALTFLLSSSIISSSIISNSAFALTKIDLNQASQKELETLPGIGEKTAQKIIAARPLKSMDDLKAIPGFKIKEIGKIETLAFVGTGTTTTTTTKTTETTIGAAKAAATGLTNTAATTTATTTAASTAATQAATQAATTAAAKATTKAGDAEKMARNTTTSAKKDLAAIGVVNLNTASLEQIEKLPGIGPKKAEAIVAGRPYKALEDLKRIKGIKEATFNKIKNNISL